MNRAETGAKIRLNFMMPCAIIQLRVMKMSIRAFTLNPQIVFRNKKPTAVLLDFREYKKILEELEDYRDLRKINRLKKQNLPSKPLEAFLKELGV